MKKIILKYGLFASAVVTLTLIITAIIGVDCVMMGPWGMVVGFGSMLIAFSFIFVAIKAYRDRIGNRSVTFGRALSIGLLISLMASTFYVATWVIEYYTIFPDFMDKYIETTLEQAKQSGLSEAELKAKTIETDQWRETYATPAGIILFTYMEILPLGILVSVIAALILKRKKTDKSVLA